MTIDGFTNSAIRVVDVTNPGAPLEVRGRVESRGNGYAVTISGQKADTRTLMAFSEPQVKRPVAIVADQPSNLKDKSQGADTSSSREEISSQASSRSKDTARIRGLTYRSLI